MICACILVRVRNQALNVEAMLRAAFLKAELDFLQSTPQFRDAIRGVKTPDQFEQLCELAEDILGAYRCAHPSAQQFRENVRH
jgi:hypothetical protein